MKTLKKGGSLPGGCNGSSATIDELHRCHSQPVYQKGGSGAASTARTLADTPGGVDMDKVTNPYDRRDIDTRLDTAARLLREALSGAHNLPESAAAALRYLEQVQTIRSSHGVD